MRGNYIHKTKTAAQVKASPTLCRCRIIHAPLLRLLFLFAERLVRFHYRASTLYQVRQAPENSGDNSPHFLLHYSPDSS